VGKTENEADVTEEGEKGEVGREQVKRRNAHRNLGYRNRLWREDAEEKRQKMGLGGKRGIWGWKSRRKAKRKRNEERQEERTEVTSTLRRRNALMPPGLRAGVAVQGRSSQSAWFSTTESNGGEVERATTKRTRC
jgi:hypothetical protein